MSLLARIERFLRDTGTPPSRFGREAVGDPGFVATLRRGREPRDDMVRRVDAWLAEARAKRTAAR